MKQKRANEKRVKRTSIKKKFILSMSVTTLVASCLLAGTFITYSYKQIKTSTEEQNSSIAQSSGQNIDTYLSKYESSIKEVASGIGTVDNGKDKNVMITNLLKNAQNNDKSLVDTYYISAKTGFMDIFPWSPYPGVARDLKAFKDTKAKGDIVWFDVYKDKGGTKEMMISITYPVKQNGKFIGALGYDISLTSIGDVRTTLEKGNSNKLIFLDNKGTLISSSLFTQMGKNVAPSFSGKYDDKGIEDILANKEGFSKQYSWADKVYSDKKGTTNATIAGTNYDASYSTIEGLNWKVVSLKPESVVTSKVNYLVKLSIIVLVVTLMIVVLLAAITSDKLVKGIKHIKDVVNKTAKGDLTILLDIRSGDELEDLSNDFNDMTRNLNSLISELNQKFKAVQETASSLITISKQNSLAIGEVTESIEEISSGTQGQTQQIENGAAAIVSLGHEIETISDKSNLIENLLNKTTNDIGKGNNDVRTLEGSYAKLETSLGMVSEIISELNKKSNNIAEVTNVISDISEQTNLLSLNASIEAARAGEAGKGFAVVAEEVKELAEKSKDSSLNIKEIIDSIITDTSSAVEFMNKTNGINQIQKEAVTNINMSMQEITSSIDEVLSQVKEEIQGIKKTTADKDNVVTMIDGISEVAQETSASTEQIVASMEEQSASSEEVNNHANNLIVLIEELQGKLEMFKFE
ncbi:methyl-accepting chemotaxis protein [Clostridium estertheticum]|uniref:methyl-accepting chemotaxis protein n=1 Tax=Clostridium estertheticum TaxID=238834 RepID=UPI001C0B8D3E|nr:methyl-accepting chemotaxis protein [Clostridium estertheticum]MBU3185281.1 methyl-accepting chemotaxis protein [Clostridium estertheticum]